MRIEDKKVGPWYGNGATGTCSCGALATCEHIHTAALACDACVMAWALAEHGVDYRRGGNQVIAIATYTDANGSTCVEEITITSPEHLHQVLGY